jgi:hypothetical protein
LGDYFIDTRMKGKFALILVGACVVRGPKLPLYRSPCVFSETLEVSREQKMSFETTGF